MSRPFCDTPAKSTSPTILPLGNRLDPHVDEQRRRSSPCAKLIDSVCPRPTRCPRESSSSPISRLRVANADRRVLLHQHHRGRLAHDIARTHHHDVLTARSGFPRLPKLLYAVRGAWRNTAVPVQGCPRRMRSNPSTSFSRNAFSTAFTGRCRSRAVPPRCRAGRIAILRCDHCRQTCAGGSSGKFDDDRFDPHVARALDLSPTYDATPHRRPPIDSGFGSIHVADGAAARSSRGAQIVSMTAPVMILAPPGHGFC